MDTTVKEKCARIIQNTFRNYLKKKNNRKRLDQTTCQNIAENNTISNNIKLELKSTFDLLNDYNKSERKEYFSETRVTDLISEVEQIISSIKLRQSYWISPENQIDNNEKSIYEENIITEATKRHEKFLNSNKENWWHSLDNGM